MSMLYEAVRDSIHTGDLILWSGTDIISRLIRLRTGSIYSHASTAMRMSGLTGDRIFHNQTTGLPIEPRYLSLTLDHYHGSCYWFALKDSWNDKRADIEKRMWTHVGTHFDYAALFMNLVCEVPANDRALFCSEEAFLDYGGKGLTPPPGKLPDLGIFQPPVRIL